MPLKTVVRAGSTNTATTNEASREKTTVMARSPIISPATPSTKVMGRNTAMVVSVEAVTAPPTSRSPSRAARGGDSPCSRRR